MAKCNGCNGTGYRGTLLGTRKCDDCEGTGKAE